jgi:hypothetical protein
MDSDHALASPRDWKRIGRIGWIAGGLVVIGRTLRRELGEYIPQTTQFLCIQLTIGVLVVPFPRPKSIEEVEGVSSLDG